MKRFALSTASVAAISYVYFEHPAPPRGSDPELVDQIITNGIPTVLFLAALVMLLSRSHWTIRGIGIFWCTVASAILMIVLGHGRSIEPGTREFLIDLARACFIVGGPAFLFGLLVWFWFWLRHSNDDDPPPETEADGQPYTGPERRTYDRRYETRMMKERLAKLEGTHQ